jgi:hypothetical protein
VETAGVLHEKFVLKHLIDCYAVQKWQSYVKGLLPEQNEIVNPGHFCEVK